MLRVLLMCTDDKASVNIRDRLIEIGDPEKIGEFQGRAVRSIDDLLLFEKRGIHLYLDDVDKEIRAFLDELDIFGSHLPGLAGAHLDLIVFLSKHRSERGIDSLTVHPPGNYLGADFGGKDGYLCPGSPHDMSAALRSLYREKKGLGLKDRTTFEVTHHGPAISSPCFFIEIGSGPDRWENPVMGEAIARSLISPDFTERNDDLPVAIGIGGGHYAPRFTDRALRRKFDFGHMIPDYILSNMDQETALKMAMEATPDAKHLFVHRSERNKELIKGVDEIAEKLCLKVHT